MKYSINFRLFAYHNGDQDLVADLPKPYDIVGAFLSTEICTDTDVEWFLEELDKALSGEVEYHEFHGNAYHLEIKKDFTKIILMYPPDEDEEIFSIIETSELKELIPFWRQKQKEFLAGTFIVE